MDDHGSSSTVPVITGLTVGIGFVVLFALATSTSDDFKSAINVTRNLSEVKAFLDAYSNANTTVYFITVCADDACTTLTRIPSTVEYSYKERDTGKYAELRIEIGHQEIRPVFFQARCLIAGTEQSGTEIHGTSIEGMTEFLLDNQCPK